MIEDRRKLRTELFYASGYIRNWQHEPSPSRDLATIASRLRKGQPDNAGGALILKSSDEQILLGLSAQRQKADLILYGHDGVAEPLLGIYSKNCIAGLEEMVFAGNYSIDDYLSASKKIIWQPESKRKPLPAHFSVDTPADYGRILSFSVS